MTSFELRSGSAQPIARPMRAGGMIQQALLACGIVSSLLYAATDLLGGLRYEGYSFTSQAVSELMAAGAPSESLVDPLFIAYDLLMVAFGIGVLRERVGRNGFLRITGALLIAYGIMGFAGPTLFEMRPRGTGSIATDLPHIILTGALVLVTLLAIGMGAFAFGRRFRVYSVATFLTMIALGVLSAPNGARLAAGLPTPGFGIVERINIYASLLWIAVLAVALLRRPIARDVRVLP
jgi:hypothetical protein